MLHNRFITHDFAPIKRGSMSKQRPESTPWRASIDEAGIDLQAALRAPVGQVDPKAFYSPRWYPGTEHTRLEGQHDAWYIRILESSEPVETKTDWSQCFPAFLRLY